MKNEVLKVVCYFYENRFDKAIIVSGAGDYASLIQFLRDSNKLLVLLSPNSKRCSILLKRLGIRITFLSDLKNKLKLKSKKKKPPISTKSYKGLFRSYVVSIIDL